MLMHVDGDTHCPKNDANFVTPGRLAPEYDASYAREEDVHVKLNYMFHYESFKESLTTTYPVVNASYVKSSPAAHFPHAAGPSH